MLYCVILTNGNPNAVSNLQYTCIAELFFHKTILLLYLRQRNGAFSPSRRSMHWSLPLWNMLQQIGWPRPDNGNIQIGWAAELEYWLLPMPVIYSLTQFLLRKLKIKTYYTIHLLYAYKEVSEKVSQYNLELMLWCYLYLYLFTINLFLMFIYDKFRLNHILTPKNLRSLYITYDIKLFSDQIM